MKRLRRARTWLTARVGAWRAQLRLGLRMTVAAVLTFWVSQLLHLPWALWAVLTSVIVTQMSVGKSLTATIDYMIGTLGGGIYSGIVGVLMPRGTDLEVALSLAVAVGPLSLLASSSSRFAAAPFTAVMVLLLPTITHAMPAESAFYRVIEVGIGCVVSFAVSLFVFPQTAQSLIYTTAAHLLTGMADLLSPLTQNLQATSPDTRIRQLQDKVGAAFQQLTATNIEASRERFAYFNSTPDPQPLIDAIRRLRNDTTLLCRAAVAPLPDPVLTRLANPLEQVGDKSRVFLTSCATALAARSRPARLDEVETALTNFSEAFAALRRDGVLREMPTDSLERVFALSFCFEQMHADFRALHTSICKMARTPKLAESKKTSFREIG